MRQLHMSGKFSSTMRFLQVIHASWCSSGVLPFESYRIGASPKKEVKSSMVYLVDRDHFRDAASNERPPPPNRQESNELDGDAHDSDVALGATTREIENGVTAQAIRDKSEAQQHPCEPRHSILERTRGIRKDRYENSERVADRDDQTDHTVCFHYAAFRRFARSGLIRVIFSVPSRY